MFLRARRICSPEFYDDEINTIYNIGNTLKYPRIFLEKCENKARSIFYRLESTKKEEKKNLLVLPFHENLNYIKPLLRILRINLVFTFPSTIKNILFKNSPCNKTPCIYNIYCKNCGGLLYRTNIKILPVIKHFVFIIYIVRTVGGLLHRINIKIIIYQNITA